MKIVRRRTPDWHDWVLFCRDKPFEPTDVFETSDFSKRILEIYSLSGKHFSSYSVNWEPYEEVVEVKLKAKRAYNRAPDWAIKAWELACSKQGVNPKSEFEVVKKDEERVTLKLGDSTYSGRVSWFDFVKPDEIEAFRDMWS